MASRMGRDISRYSSNVGHSCPQRNSVQLYSEKVAKLFTKLVALWHSLVGHFTHGTTPTLTHCPGAGSLAVWCSSHRSRYEGNPNPRCCCGDSWRSPCRREQLKTWAVNPYPLPVLPSTAKYCRVLPSTTKLAYRKLFGINLTQSI